MEILIDIPEEMWERVKDGYVPLGISKYLKNGVSLPKGHGRLIDTDDIRVIELDDGVHFIQHKKGDDIDVYIDAPTIIEADKLLNNELENPFNDSRFGG